MTKSVPTGPDATKAKKPVVKIETVDESGLGRKAPAWVTEPQEKIDNSRLKEIVLVGSCFDETATELE